MIGKKEAGPAVTIDTSPKAWYDLWHIHSDIAFRPRSPTLTRAVLRDLRKTFRTAQAQLKGWSKPHQCWVLIDPTELEQSAVYIHTPNPNKKNYPYKFATVSWGATRIPAWIRAEFPPSRFKLGRSTYRGNLTFWAKAP